MEIYNDPPYTCLLYTSNEKPEYYKGLSPIASAGSDTLRVAGEQYRRTYISGVNEDYTTLNNYKVAKGRGIQYTDLIDLSLIHI